MTLQNSVLMECCGQKEKGATYIHLALPICSLQEYGLGVWRQLNMYPRVEYLSNNYVLEYKILIALSKEKG